MRHEKTVLFLLIIFVSLSGTCLHAEDLTGKDRDLRTSLSDQYRDEMREGQDLKNAAQPLNYVVPTAEGNRYDAGTVNVEKPRELTPTGGQCPEGYVCRSLEEGRDTRCIYYGTQYAHERSSTDCSQMTYFCARVLNDYKGVPPQDGLYKAACTR